MSNDFSKGPVWRRILAQAVPLTLAQLVQQAALYVRRAVPPQAFQALSRCGRPRGRASPASPGSGVGRP